MNSDAFQERHNRFIDSMFSRINRIFSEVYSPLFVRLSRRSTSIYSEAEASKRKISTKNILQTDAKKETEHTTKTNLTTDSYIATHYENKPQEKRIVFSKFNSTEEQRTALSNFLPYVNDNLLGRKTFNNNRKQSNKGETKNDKKIKKTSGTKNNKESSSSSSQNYNGKQIEQLEKTEGSLSGLDSLKRIGNVKVVSDPVGQNSTIKAKFTLGPLILRVEKYFKRGNVRRVKSATARTNQMVGRIVFSVANKRATLMSIKVQQPKQVEVENMDHRRDIVWRRSPKIAKLVNERLKYAAETILSIDGLEGVNL